MSDTTWLEQVQWSADGLVPAIAQDVESGRILMMAWMNRAALLETVNRGQAVYWSRSRDTLWHKGEESGHFQFIEEIRLDCDSDVIILGVRQTGGVACHTGRESCFFRLLKEGIWSVVDPVIKDPAEIYDHD